MVYSIPAAVRCRRSGSETLLSLIAVVGSVEDDILVHLMLFFFYVAGFFSIGVSTISVVRAVRRINVVSGVSVPFPTSSRILVDALMITDLGPVDTVDIPDE